MEIRMKRTLSLLLCLCLVLTTLAMAACNGTPDGGDGLSALPKREPPAPPSEGLEYELKTTAFGSYYEVTGMGSCTDTLVVIPDTYNGQPVRGIAAGAFHAKKAAPAVTPTAAGGTRASGAGAARGLSAVTVRPVEDPVTAPVPPEHQITEIFIPDSVTEIGDEAFLDCEKLADIDTARLVSMIGTDAFKNTAFYKDESNWEEGVLYLENYLVDVREGFCGILTVREGTVHVADRALAGHSGITEVRLPSSIRVVGNYAFTDCLSLTAINLDHPGIQIGNHAFAGCVSLTAVKISTDDEPTQPNEGDLPQYTINPDLSIGGGGIVITPGTGASGTGAYQPGGSVSVGGTVGGNFIAIANFAQSSTLDPNFIYSGVVGNHAFDGCTALSSVSFGKNVGKIGSFAFSGCTSLVSIDMSPLTLASKTGGMLVITPGAFTFSAEVQLTEAFVNCTALTSVVLPAGLTELNGTFTGCSSLTSFTVPEGVKRLTSAFRGCTALTSVSLPSTLTSLDSTFRGCSALASVEIPARVTEVGTNAFRDCVSLDSLYLPDAVTYIGEFAFRGMKSTATVSVGSAVTYIGADALGSLDALTYRGTVEAWRAAVTEFDADFAGDRRNSGYAVYCTNGTVGELPDPDGGNKDEELPPPVNPDKPENPIPEWIAEIESMILPNGVIYFRRNGVTLRLMGTNVTPSPISYNELLENPPAGAREMTEREKADVFDEKLMESIRDLTE